MPEDKKIEVIVTQSFPTLTESGDGVRRTKVGERMMLTEDEVKNLSGRVRRSGNNKRSKSENEDAE